jgi:hypothetical protein
VSIAIIISSTKLSARLVGISTIRLDLCSLKIFKEKLSTSKISQPYFFSPGHILTIAHGADNVIGIIFKL